MEEIEAWIEEQGNDEEKAEAQMNGDIGASDKKWKVYAALERLDRLGSCEFIQEDVASQL